MAELTRLAKIALAIEAVRALLPDGITLWRNPGIAPPGYIDLSRGQEFFPTLDADGESTSTWACYLMKPMPGEAGMFYGLQFELSDEPETVAVRFIEAAKELAAKESL